MDAQERRPLNLFISFVESDADLKNELLRHLSVLRRIGRVRSWSTDDLRPGATRQDEIDHALERSDVALVLLSSNYFASDDAQGVQLPKILERHSARGLQVIPVLLRSCRWEAQPWLNTLQPLPRDGTALAAHQGDERDQVLTEIVVDIAALSPLDRNVAPAEAVASTPPVPTWVLVAGSGKSNTLSLVEEETCTRLGRGLAERGFCLITGGWPGVDRAVASSFAETLRTLGRPSERYLLQTVRRGSSPAYTGGDLLFVDRGDQEWTAGIERADAVVLIGGFGGTLRTGRMAMKAGRLVLPIADTGNDAKKLYLEIVSKSQRDHSDSIQGIPREQFLVLGRSAPSVVLDLLNLIEELFRRPKQGKTE